MSFVEVLTWGGIWEIQIPPHGADLYASTPNLSVWCAGLRNWICRYARAHETQVDLARHVLEQYHTHAPNATS